MWLWLYGHAFEIKRWLSVGDGKIQCFVDTCPHPDVLPSQTQVIIPMFLHGKSV